MTMTSRERVQKSINHEEPDRIPFDLNPLFDFYIELKNYLKLDLKENVKHNLAMEVIPHPDVLKKLNVDIISVKLGSPKTSSTEESANGLVRDAWGVLFKLVSQPAGGRYYEAIESPLKDATIDDLEKYPWPVADLPGRGEGAEKSAKRLYEDTDLALLGRFGGPITETALFMLGMENWMMRLALEPDFINVLLEKITDVQIALDRIGLESTAKYLQIFKASGEDLGMQTGPLYSPKMFKEQLLPHLARRIKAAKSFLRNANPNVKIMLHSCGSIRKFIPDLIEAGVDIIDPIQPHAAGMGPVGLKKDFGKEITFHGGIDIQEVLPFGTEEEIEKEVNRRIQALGVGGGYILSPAHNVQADIPPKNLVAMYRAAIKHGQYPILL
jgi:uroporphyrinogen decarboxylase